MRKKHDLFDFMEAVKQDMGLEYKRIRERATEDPSIAGSQGEGSWAEFFKNWLPSNYHVVTKGRILNERGESTPEIDILILHPSYPKKLLALDKKYYLAGGVVAAFECKLTLKTRDIVSAIQKSVQIKEMIPIKNGTPYDELHHFIIYGLLAHSHSYKCDYKKAAFDILERLNTHAAALGSVKQ